MERKITDFPQHIAFIMDGNGRWAEKQNQPRSFGHKAGTNAVKECIKAGLEFGVKYLTFYSFSKENWNRPKEEVDFLMDLLAQSIENEKDEFIANGIQLKLIGDINELPQRLVKALKEIIEKTLYNKKLTVIIALNYSSKWEIVEATKKIALNVKMGLLTIDDINDNVFSKNLQTNDFPDPDLLIRTSGELRISNFLLWQIAYSELFFTEIFWPDFSKEELRKAIENYRLRKRRFGKIK